MEVQGERKDEDRGPSYEGGYLYSDICRTWDRTGHIAMQSQRCSIRQAYTLRR